MSNFLDLFNGKSIAINVNFERKGFPHHLSTSYSFEKR